MVDQQFLKKCGQSKAVYHSCFGYVLVDYLLLHCAATAFPLCAMDESSTFEYPFCIPFVYLVAEVQAIPD